MAMTEWQDVGMSGAEKEQLQAIYDAVIAGQVVFNMEGVDTLNPVTTGTLGTGNKSYTWVADKDYPYILIDCLEVNGNTKDIVWTLSEGEDYGKCTTAIGSAGIMGFSDISFALNVKAGDTVVISKTSNDSQLAYTILRNRTT